MSKGFDLGSLESADTTVIDLLHPISRVPIGATITIYGADSEVYRNIERVQLNKRLQNAMKKGKVTAEQIEAEKMDVLVKATKSWEGVALDGEELSCTPDNVRTVYNRFPAIKEQVDEAIVDRTLFMKG